MPAAVIPQVCPRCKFRPESWVNDCPQCGQVIVSPGRVRALGWVLVVLGSILAIGMAALSVTMARVVAGSGEPGATTTYTGSAEQMGVMFTLFAFVGVFGIVSMVVGGWQVRTGRQNPRLAAVAFFFFMAFMGLVMYMQYAA